MKNFAKLITIALALLMCSSCYIKKEAEPESTITVQATGSATQEPDTATVLFQVVTSGWSAKQITQDSDTLTKRLTDAIKNAGVNESDISISNCNISLVNTSYESRRTVLVTVRNIGILSNVVDCKPAGNTVRLSKVEYSVSDEASLIRRARSAAIQQAQDAASLLAGASGNKPGTVRSVSEDKIVQSVSADGTISLVSNVTITYTLQ